MPVTKGEQWITAAEFSFASYAVRISGQVIVLLSTTMSSHLNQCNEGILPYTNPEALLPGES